MPVHTMECACGHAFTIDESDYGHTGRCPGCNRNVRVYLVHGDAFLEPVKSINGQVLPVLGLAPANNAPTHEHTVKIRLENHAADPVSLFESDGEGEDEGEYKDEVHAPRVPVPKCDRCGKAFRGEWDKHSTDRGMLCYICSTLVIDSPEKNYAPKEPEPTHRTINMSPPPVLNVMAEYSEQSNVLQEHQGKFILAGISMALLLCILIFPVEKIIPTLMTPYTEEDLKNAPQNVIQFAGIIPYLLRGLGIFLWVYLGLAMTDNLPNRLFRHNAIVVGVYAIGFFILQFCASTYLPSRLRSPDEIFMVVILYHTFDLSFLDVLKLIVLGAVITLLLSPVSMLFQGLYLGLVL